MSALGYSIFGREMLFNFASFLYWKVVTAAKYQQADIANVRKKIGMSRMTTQVAI